MAQIRLVILGRDGILNQYRSDHVKAPEEWVPVPGALEAVAKLTHAGWHMVVATNQSGIGRGLVDMASVNAVHARMHQMLLAQGGRIDAVLFCPHAPEDDCTCRKPKPGLMHEVARRYGVNLAQVPMLCDTLRDLQAASQAGCEPHLIKAGGRAATLSAQELAQWAQEVPGLRVHADLDACVEHLLARDPQSPHSSPGVFE